MFALYMWATRNELPAPIGPIANPRAVSSPLMPVPESAIFTTLDGQEFPLAKLKGRTILLNFWATWCPPCVKEFPALIRLTKEMKGKVALVAVSNDTNVETVKKFLNKLPEVRDALPGSPDIFVVYDKNGKTTSEQFAVFRFPESFVIDRNYLIARKLVGEVDWLRRDLFAYFQEIAQTIPFQSPHL